MNLLHRFINRLHQLAYLAKFSDSPSIPPAAIAAGRLAVEHLKNGRRVEGMAAAMRHEITAEMLVASMREAGL